MGLLGDMVKKGVSDAVSKGVSKGVEAVVKPKVEQAAAKVATNAANKVADAINDANAANAQAAGAVSEAEAAAGAAVSEAEAAAGVTVSEAEAAAGATPAANTASSNLNSALGNLASALGSLNTAETKESLNSLGQFISANESTLESMAANMVKDKKTCPKCGQMSDGDKLFCPNCGTELPKMTLGQLTTCSNCGTENAPGTRFCTKCGSKLPVVELEEQAFAADWEKWIPMYPKWELGGGNIGLDQVGEDNGYPIIELYTDEKDDTLARQYAQVLLDNGFAAPEGYNGNYTLYKVVDGICRVWSMENCLDGDCLCTYFYVRDFVKEAEERAAKAEADRKANTLSGKLDKASEGLKDVKDAAKKLGSFFK